MRTFNNKIKSRGFALLQVLVSFGILSVAIAAVLTIITNQNTELSRIRIKTELIELPYAIRAIVSNPTACVDNFKTINDIGSGLVNNVNTANEINFTQNGIVTALNASSFLKGGVGQSSSLSPGVNVTNLSLANIKPAGFNAYSADMIIKVKNGGFEFKPIEVRGLVFTLDGTNKVSACSVAGGGGGGGAYKCGSCHPSNEHECIGYNN